MNTELNFSISIRQFQSHFASHKIYAYTIKICLSFMYTAIDRSGKVINYVVKQFKVISFILYVVLVDPG